MNRWVHGLFALVALVTIVGLALFWPRPDRVPSPDGAPTLAPGPGSDFTPIPQPTGPSATTPTDRASGPSGTPSPPPPTCSAAPPARLAMLTFNIHGALGGGGLDLERIAREIEAWDADVVLLQEVDRFRARSGFVDEPAWLGERLDMNVVFGRNVVRLPERRGAPRSEYGTAVLTTLPVRRWTNRLLPRYPGQEQRGLLRVTLDLDGQPFDVFNTHLQHTRGNIRIVQLQAVRRMVGDAPYPFVLGGDLNATPDSPAMAVARSFARDPWPVVGRGGGLTVPPRVPRRRIDYVLHSDDLVPTSAQVFRSAISDHRAVRVTLDVPQPGCGR